MKLNAVYGIRKPPLRDYFENRTPCVRDGVIDRPSQGIIRTNPDLVTNIVRLPPVAFPAVRRLRFLYLPRIDTWSSQPLRVRGL
jgi:hypothetical protein